MQQAYILSWMFTERHSISPNLVLVEAAGLFSALHTCLNEGVKFSDDIV